MDGNYIAKMKFFNRKVLPKEVKKMKEHLDPILKISKELEQLEIGRTKEYQILAECMVRMGKGFKCEFADLLSFDDR